MSRKKSVKKTKSKEMNTFLQRVMSGMVNIMRPVKK
jgi:hypothetical protein